MLQEVRLPVKEAEGRKGDTGTPARQRNFQAACTGSSGRRRRAVSMSTGGTATVHENRAIMAGSRRLKGTEEERAGLVYTHGWQVVVKWRKGTWCGGVAASAPANEKGKQYEC